MNPLALVLLMVETLVAIEMVTILQWGRTQGMLRSMTPLFLAPRNTLFLWRNIYFLRRKQSSINFQELANMISEGPNSFSAQSKRELREVEILLGFGVWSAPNAPAKKER